VVIGVNEMDGMRRALRAVRVRLRAAVIVVVSAGALIAAPRAAHAHPLHTTMSEVTIDAQRHVMRIVVRAFADDYLKAAMAARHLNTIPTLDGADAFAYLQSALSIDEGSHTIPLRSCGFRTRADVVWLCVETALPVDAARAHIRNALLWNLFDDQVNIVRATIGTNARSLLFVKGDRAKPLA
jgi:hypothetical protein